MQIFLRLAALLAMMIAPVAMSAGHAAVPARAQAAHCAQMGGDHEPDRSDSRMIDCTIACTMLPVQPALVTAPPIEPGAAPDAQRAGRRGGISPGFDPPPPRR